MRIDHKEDYVTGSDRFGKLQCRSERDGVPRGLRRRRRQGTNASACDEYYKNETSKANTFHQIQVPPNAVRRCTRRDPLALGSVRLVLVQAVRAGIRSSSRGYRVSNAPRRHAPNSFPTHPKSFTNPARVSLYITIAKSNAIANSPNRRMYSRVRRLNGLPLADSSTLIRI